MPQLANGVTKSSKSVWRSPDGQREIFEVVMDFDGSALKAKTYSKDISVVGWAGDVEAYEKEGRNGPETFVKQPQKEQAAYGGGGTRSEKAAYQPRDDSHIKAQWAIGQAVSVLTSNGELDLELTESLADDLFNMVDRVKSSGADSPENQTQADDVIHEVSDEPMDLSTLDEILGKTTPVTGEEPWPKK